MLSSSSTTSRNKIIWFRFSIRKNVSISQIMFVLCQPDRDSSQPMSDPGELNVRLIVIQVRFMPDWWCICLWPGALALVRFGGMGAWPAAVFVLVKWLGVQSEISGHEKVLEHVFSCNSLTVVCKSMFSPRGRMLRAHSFKGVTPRAGRASSLHPKNTTILVRILIYKKSSEKSYFQIFSSGCKNSNRSKPAWARANRLQIRSSTINERFYG